MLRYVRVAYLEQGLIKISANATHALVRLGLLVRDQASTSGVKLDNLFEFVYEAMEVTLAHALVSTLLQTLYGSVNDLTAVVVSRGCDVL